MRCLALCSMLLLAAPVAGAQSATGPNAATNPLTASTYMVYAIVRGNITKAAEEMPEANYSFQATPKVRTYGQLIGHLADASYAFCSAAKGEKSPGPKDIEKTVTAKADLVKALNAAFAYCDQVYSGLTDAQLGDKVNFFGQQATRLGVLTFNSAHDDEHYGNIVTYLRLKDLVPPSSQKGGM